MDDADPPKDEPMSDERRQAIIERLRAEGRMPTLNQYAAQLFKAKAEQDKEDRERALMIQHTLDFEGTPHGTAWSTELSDRSLAAE